MNDKNTQKLVYVMHVDHSFDMYRIALASAAREQGYEVIVLAPDTGNTEGIKESGFPYLNWTASRTGTNPLRELSSLYRLYRLYRRLRPALVHHRAFKPTIYGSIAARLAGVGCVVNALNGLGYMFSDERNGVVRSAIDLLIRFALRHPNSCTIFQNPDDQDLFVSRRLVPPSRTAYIRNGVDCEQFAFTPELDQDRPIVMLPTRLLWTKGVGEFVQAARLLQSKGGPEARFVLVGEPDKGNPDFVPEEQLRAWHQEGVIEWWGRRENMPSVLAETALVVLPSTYREGMPRIILEAAAVGRATITTDWPGCRDTVKHGETGLLIPPRDPGALAAAIYDLLWDSERRKRMGVAARQMVVDEFSIERMNSETLDVYRSLLEGQLVPA